MNKASIDTHLIQAVQHSHSRLPIDASISNRDAVLQCSRTFGRNVLASGVDMRLDHNASDATVSCTELLADVVDDLGLIVVVLL